MRMKPWNVDWVLRNTFRKLTGRKTLDKEREERMAVLREMLYPGETQFVRPGLTKAYFGKLAHDFTVSTIALTDRKGEVLAANRKTSTEIEQSLFDSVAEKIPDAKYLLIKGEKKTHVVCPDNGSLLIVEAMGNVSPIEMKALLRRVREGEDA